MRPPDPSVVLVPGPWTHRAVSANGIRQHVVECGDGPLVVLLHGFPEFWWSWRHQLPALAARGYRAVAVDLRGYGDTDKPPRGYDLWTLAGDVSGLIGALGESRAHVVGHDWGGIIAWTLAALHPRRVRSVTAVAAPHPLAIRSRVLPILQATKDRYEGRVRRGYPTIIDNVQRGGIFGMTLDSGFGIYFQTDGQRLFAEVHVTHLRTDTLSAANAEKFGGEPYIDQIDIDGSWSTFRYRDLLSRLLVRWDGQQTRNYRTDS